VTITELWESIPGPIRTIINVVLGAVVLTLGESIVAAGGVPTDINALGQALLLAASTAFVRAINPLDSVYGAGSKPKPEPEPVDPEAVDFVQDELPETD
jgi:hypothetical protein